MPKDHLRAVGADEKPAKREKAKSLKEAIEGGVYLEILEAQQREIASAVGDEKGPAKAALYRQLALISKEIQQLRAAAAEEAAENGEGATADEAFDVSAV